MWRKGWALKSYFHTPSKKRKSTLRCPLIRIPNPAALVWRNQLRRNINTGQVNHASCFQLSPLPRINAWKQALELLGRKARRPPKRTAGTTADISTNTKIMSYNTKRGPQLSTLLSCLNPKTGKQSRQLLENRL